MKFSFLIFFFFSLPVGAQSIFQKYGRFLTEPRSYVCYRTDGKLKIDGKLDEVSWQKAKPTAPFVDISRKKIRKAVIAERQECHESMDEDIINTITERRLREEIKSGIQTIQYQLITLMTCNGQAPFVTMFMYLDEVPEGQTREPCNYH